MWSGSRAGCCPGDIGLEDERLMRETRTKYLILSRWSSSTLESTGRVVYLKGASGP